ncbi:MAG TPA: hypothetical protein DCM62_04510, partial [Bacteroidales bacterium]|nr:hypothetical protein [Bacteroidales bacterium]
METQNHPKQKFSIPMHQMILFGILLIGISIGSYWVLQLELDHIFGSKVETISSVARLKSTRISEWYADENHDLQHLSQNNFLIELVQNYLTYNTNKSKQRLQQKLNQLSKEHNFCDIFVFSLNGTILASSGTLDGTLAIIEQEKVRIAIQQETKVTTDLFKHETPIGRKIFISFAFVLHDTIGNVLAGVVTRLDPAQFLYPIIETLPLPSRTAESFIFRVENDTIVYLSNLRHRANTALNLRLPVSHLELPASQAIRGKLGPTLSVDYRGIDVLSYAAKVESTPWYLITKVDMKEVLEERFRVAFIVFGFSLLLLILSFLAAWFIRNRREKTMYRDLYWKEKELLQNQELYKITMDSLEEGIIVTDLKANVQYMNRSASVLTGWGITEALGKKVNEVYSVIIEDTGEKQDKIFENVVVKGTLKEMDNHTLLLYHKDGNTLPVMNTGAPVFDVGGELTGIVVAFQDETQSKQQKRLLMESEAFTRSVLSSLTDHIMVVDNTGTIISSNENINQFGLLFCSNTLENITLSSNFFDDCKKAINQGNPIAKDVLEGIFNVLDGRKDSFQIEYLFQTHNNQKWFNLRVNPLVGDKNKIVLAHEDITDRKLAEEARLELLNRLNLISQNIPGMLYQYKLLPDETSYFPWSSDGIKKLYGVEAKEVLLDATPVFNAIYPADKERVFTSVRESAIKLTVWQETFRVNLPNGETIWVSGQSIPQKLGDGSVLWHGVLLDITSSKLSEDELFRKDQLLHSIVETQKELIIRFLPDTTLTFVNMAFCTLFGKSEKELIGSKFIDLVPESEVEYE